MFGSRIGYLVLLTLVVLALVHMAVYYPSLPPQVMSHFDARGQANGSMGKNAFMAVYAGTILVTALVILLFSLFLPRLRNSMINLPNKDYWLAPERKKASAAVLSGMMVWFGNATLVLLIACFHVCFAATLGRASPPWLFPLILGDYLTYTLAWCICLIRRFRKPKPA
ncbi:MAG: DUF1648 domain-containing protein [Pirellulaceae bacterium]|nr:DUF1648 domain-containing protein [Pirellulaceae bacterium]